MLLLSKFHRDSSNIVQQSKFLRQVKLIWMKKKKNPKITDVKLCISTIKRLSWDRETHNICCSEITQNSWRSHPAILRNSSENIAFAVRSQINPTSAQNPQRLRRWRLSVAPSDQDTLFYNFGWIIESFWAKLLLSHHYHPDNI